MTTIPKPPVYLASLIQLIALIIVSVVVFGLILLLLVLSFWGLNQLLPQVWFAYFAFKHVGANQTHSIVSSMYRGETGKVLLAATGFIAVFVLFEQVNIIGFMFAFVGMIPLQLFLVAKIVK